MGRLRIGLKKGLFFLVLSVLAGSFMGIGRAPAVSAAAKTVTVKNVKKKLKVTSGNYVYQVTLVSKKKSTVSVVGATAKARKKLTKVVIPKSVRIRSKSGRAVRRSAGLRLEIMSPPSGKMHFPGVRTLRRLRSERL